MYRLLLTFFITSITWVCLAQQDSTLIVPITNPRLPTDTLKTTPISVIDTLAPKLVRKLDSLSIAIQELAPKSTYGFPTFSLKNWLNTIKFPDLTWDYQAGNPINKGATWPLLVLLILVGLVTIYKNIFGKQLLLIIQSFFSNRALAQLHKEEKPSSSWALISLFILLSFTTGFYLYHLYYGKQLSSDVNSVKTYFSLSIFLIVFFLLKIVFINLFGFVFELQRVCKEYVTTLYMLFYNIALCYLPLVIILTLQPNLSETTVKLVGLILIPSIFLLQFIRIFVNFLTQYKFPKMYLILYLCAFEICPLLILIKAVGLMSTI